MTIDGRTIYVESMGVTRKGTVTRVIGNTHVEFTLPDDYPGFVYFAPIDRVRLSLNEIDAHVKATAHQAD